MTRHDLHWIDWMAERPEIDYGDPRNDLRMMKSGVYHFGRRCRAGDPSGKKMPSWTKDSGSRILDRSDLHRGLTRLTYSAFGACMELVQFFLQLLDPALLGMYQRVAREVGKLGYIPFETRRTDDPFVLRALLVNIITNEHKDKGDWRGGFAGLVCLGDFDGDRPPITSRTRFPHRIPSRMRPAHPWHEPRHSITKWTGRRFVVVNATHEAVCRWARWEVGEDDVPESTTTADTCLDADLGGIVPEHQAIVNDRDSIPERYFSESDSEYSHSSAEESEVSMGSVRALAKRAHEGRRW
ncbi:hypothetical protein DL767_009940 [Monosporascus sp. MG133]|nr:hypothetical protein DL767_009940 [Monosporascus sp. MG133]